MNFNYLEDSREGLLRSLTTEANSSLHNEERTTFIHQLHAWFSRENFWINNNKQVLQMDAAQPVITYYLIVCSFNILYCLHPILLNLG